MCREVIIFGKIQSLTQPTMASAFERRAMTRFQKIRRPPCRGGSTRCSPPSLMEVEMDKSTVRSRRADATKSMLWALLPTLLLVLTHPHSTYAHEVVTTNITATTTAPLDLDTDVNPVGTITEIRGGTRPNNGANLFHSFDAFTLGTNDVAHFINNMQLPTTNIIARVIGGERSTIDGTLRTNNPLDAADPMNFGAANLWLVNPSGLLLGPNARVEVGGSVSMSTANYLRFEGTTTLFDMLSTPASLGSLSVAPVLAFGFLGPDLPAPITVQGSMLQVPQGQSLSLVGGDITIQAGTLDNGTVQAANLLAPGGHINLVSVASPGEVLVPSFQTGPNINGASFTTMGTVTLKEVATVDVSGQLGTDADGNPIGGNSGTVLVRGGQLVMNASTIQAFTRGAVDGARTAVDIQASQKVELTNNASIKTITFGSGRGGDVQLTAPTLTIENAPESIVTATIDGDGAGGDVVLNVGTLSLMGGSSILSQSQTFTPEALGQGGNVIIRGLQGVGSAAESVTLSGGSSLVTQTFGSSNGGQVAITSKSLTMDGPGTTIKAEATDVGRAGNLVVSVQEASLSGGAIITASQAFNADLDTQPGLTVQGLEGAGSMAESVVLSGLGSGIISDSSGTARAGDIAVQAKTVSLEDGAVIQAGTTITPAAGGNVTIVADSLGISGGSRISSQASHSDAGQITITANMLNLDNGSIETNTLSEGRGGDVVLNVGTTVSLSNGAKINSSTSAAGRAGDITMTVGSLTLANHSEITNSSTGGIEIEAGAGNAGNITIQSGSTVVLNNSSITTEAESASGGQITINAPEMVRLTNSRVSTSVAGSDADTTGGNITIDPQFVILQNSQIIAQAFAGSGGAINVIAGVFIADPNSVVDASSQQGPQGTVNIQSPVQNVGGELAALSDEFASVAALLAQQCAARAADGKFSTFVVAAREGLPAEPGGFLASPSLTSELLGSRLSGRDLQPQLSAVTGLFQKYDVRPIQLAMFGNTCRS